MPSVIGLCWSLQINVEPDRFLTVETPPDGAFWNISYDICHKVDNSHRQTPGTYRLKMVIETIGG
jgi:hypothetical protein